MKIKHIFESERPDGSDPTQIQPSHWNDDHIGDSNSDKTWRLAIGQMLLGEDWGDTDRDGVLNSAVDRLEIVHGEIVDTIDMGRGGALITPGSGSAVSSTERYLAFYPSSTNIISLFNPADTSNRIDAVIIRVTDLEYGTYAVEVVAGTPDEAPTAPTLPENCILLATVYIPANEPDVDNWVITDQRQFISLRQPDEPLWQNFTPIWTDIDLDEFSTPHDLGDGTLTGKYRLYVDTEDYQVLDIRIKLIIGNTTVLSDRPIQFGIPLGLGAAERFAQPAFATDGASIVGNHLTACTGDSFFVISGSAISANHIRIVNDFGLWGAAVSWGGAGLYDSLLISVDGLRVGAT